MLHRPRARSSLRAIKTMFMLRRAIVSRGAAAAACAASAIIVKRHTADAAAGPQQNLASQLAHGIADEEQRRNFEQLQATTPARLERSDRWYQEWLEQELADHPPAMTKDGWTPLKVWSVIPQSANCKLVRFVFDDPHASAGMEVASYLLTRAFIGKEKKDGSRGAVVRPYTPSHTTIGYLELVVKQYEEGKMSRHINSLQKGDTLEFKGPITGIPIVQNEFESIGLIAGGSGITPMLQIAQRVLNNPDDQTFVTSPVVTDSHTILGSPYTQWHLSRRDAPPDATRPLLATVCSAGTCRSSSPTRRPTTSSSRRRSTSCRRSTPSR